MFLSADVGETFKEELVGFDAEVIPLVDVVNVACGGHGGTFSSITTAINLAKENRVKIAAHPSYLEQGTHNPLVPGSSPGGPTSSDGIMRIAYRINPT